MQLACINCIHLRQKKTVFTCDITLDRLSMDELFDTEECPHAIRLFKKHLCPNCLGTGYSKGQECPCSEKD